MKIYELGHAVLYVTHLERSASFYRDILGFPEIGRGLGMVAFSSGRTHHELLLIEIGGESRKKIGVEPGLYHLGFKVGNSKKELKVVLDELKKKNVPIVGMSDHTVTLSIYILDPDGNELELYVDVSDDWKKDASLVLKAPRRLDL